MDHIAKLEAEAAARVRAVLAMPMQEHPEMRDVSEFSPWELFPSLYGCYDSEFDRCAIEVLEDIRDRTWKRQDLAAQMFREMLCTADLCAYGTSPRACFPTAAFAAVLPDLIAKWRAYSLIQWGEDVAA